MAPQFPRTSGVAFVVALHVIPALGLLYGATARDWALCAGFYVVAGIGGGVGLHRYFAHHAFRTSRAFQFVLALLATATVTEPIAFTGKHRLHHRHADTKQDVHTPRQGFWFCWFGSLFERPERAAEIQAMAADLMRYPELVWLHRLYYVPALALGAVTWWLGGFSAFAVGFVLSRALVLHAVSALNFFCHRGGRRRYATPDASTNNGLIAVITFGEGWHNNHHRFPHSARAGFRWWEVDMIYYFIRLLAAVRLVWGLREVPRHLRRATCRMGAVARKA